METSFQSFDSRRSATMAAPVAPPRAELLKPMPAPTKLCYFNITGLGEPVRFMLAYGGEEFIDDRMTSEQFAERKECFPFGKVPYLEIDGLFLHQSMAICRYLAHKHGLDGGSRERQTEADVMADTVNDLRSGLTSYFWEQDAAAKESKREGALKQAGYYLDKLEKIVDYNKGFLVQGGKLTWPDVVWASLSGYLSHMAGSDLLASRPALKGLQDKVLALPNIQKYLAARPQHPF